MAKQFYDCTYFDDNRCIFFRRGDRHAPLPVRFSEAVREKEMPRLLTVLESLLSKRLFLVGTDFSVVDVAVGSILAYVPIMLKLNFDDYPAVADYVKRLVERPAFQSSIGRR